MCPPQLLIPAIATGLLGVAATKLVKSPSIDMGNFSTYSAQEPPQAAAAPEAPVAAPVMTTQGQGEAEDEQKATDQRIRRQRQGRNALRIDRTLPNTSGLGGGSGVNVPT